MQLLLPFRQSVITEPYLASDQVIILPGKEKGALVDDFKGISFSTAPERMSIKDELRLKKKRLAAEINSAKDF